MPSTIETGHAKNVANFQELMSYCEGYAATYNPSKESLKLESLKKMLLNAKQILETLIGKHTACNNAITARQNAFANIKSLTTRVVNAFEITDAPSQSMEDMRALNKKLQGTRTAKKAMPTPVANKSTALDTKSISTSQQSYDQITEHFAKIISVLSAERSYTPNETDLQVKTLSMQLDTMRQSTSELMTALSEASNARIARNNVLYNDTPNLYDTAMDIKKYIKSVFGATSPQYKQVSNIRFSKTR